MKKFLSLLLALVLMLSVTVTASAQEVVKFWTHTNNAWNASYEELIAEFEAANPEIKIEYTNFPYADFEAKMQSSLMAGEPGADVYEAWGGWMLNFASSGVLSEIPSVFLEELLKDVYEPVMGTLQYQGKYYGAPLELNAGYGGMVVNKKLFNASGLPYPTTWKEVLETAKKVAVQDGEMMTMRGLEFITWDVLYFNWMAMILQNGGNFLDAQGKVDLATPEAIAAMTELVSYIKDDHVTNLDSLTGAQAVIEHGFMCIDEAYMAINGPWIVPDCETSYGLTYGEDFEYIAQPPFVEGKTEWAAETGWSLAVANSSKVADASWKFVEFLLQPANLLRHNIDCGQIPPRKSVANDPALIEAVPYLAPLISILDSAKYVGNYDPGTVKEFTKQMFISLVSDDGTYASVEEACQKLNADLEANVKYY